MSDNVQPARAAKAPRAERVTTSCSECRRRKQKCNQGHPCSHCARRFPQPRCEYKENRRRPEPVPNTSSFVITLQQRGTGLDLPGFNQPLLPAAEHTAVRTGDSPESCSIVSWSGTDILTEFPGSGTSGTLKTVEWGETTAPLLPCEPGCREHSATVHDATRLLKYTHNIPNRFIARWEAGYPEEDVDWNEAVGPGSDLYSFSSPIQLLHSLPLAPTSMNSHLLQIFVKLISRFKASLDGNPDVTSPYHRVYMPFCIQNPLLVHVAIYTAACYLNEAKKLDKYVAIQIKGQAIHMLNERLRSEHTAASDEAIAGVCQLIMDEWYWGETRDLRAHLNGMRQMIRLRGGFRNLGLDGLLSKMVILADLGIAITFEVEPYLQNGPGYDFTDDSGTFRLAHACPLVASTTTFASCADLYGIHETTASILDDVRFLIALTISAPEHPDEQEQQKLESTARWIHSRIQSLPPDGPYVPDSPASSFERASSFDRASPQYSDTSTSVASDGQSPSSVGSDTSSMRMRSGPDYVYQAIRLAALIYTSAIVNRQPLSEACSISSFYELWTTIWRVPLSMWKTMTGIFLWIELAIIPASRDTPHGRFVKSMFTIASLTMGIEHWPAINSTLRGAILLQARLGRRNPQILM